MRRLSNFVAGCGVFGWVRLLLAVTVSICYAAAVWSLAVAGFVPLIYWLLGGLVCLPVVVWLDWALVSTGRRRWAQIVAAVAAGCVTLASLYVVQATGAFVSLLDSTQSSGSYQEYYVVAKRSRHVVLSPATSHSFGLLESDPNAQLVRAELDKLSHRANVGYYPQLASLTAALDGGKTDTMVLAPAYMRLLQDNNMAFYDSVEVISTIRVRAKLAVSVQADTTKPFVVYISGIDTYGAVSTVSRSDVNILAVVNPVTHQILLVNTPRDYYVQLHGTTGVRDKLTHAGVYGVGMSMATLQDLYDTHIDYYVRINFDSLTRLVSALGGVDVQSAYDFKAGGYTFHKGLNHLDDKAALAFARERYSFAEGDRVRGQNQQRVIEAIVQKVSTPAALVNLPHVLSSLQGAFQTNASQNTISSLISQQMSSLAVWHTSSISVNGTGAMAPTYSMGSLPLYVMEPDMGTVDTARQQIKTIKGDGSSVKPQ